MSCLSGFSRSLLGVTQRSLPESIRIHVHRRAIRVKMHQRLQTDA